MEGPTPSSAIFYGSLSVHIGVFLLLKTFPFWEHQLSVRILIGALGLTTSVITIGIARVQSSIKSQIAYSSIAQIGLIFIEVAAGFENLALFHFAGNAFLRTYQLLVSPSVVSYLIKEQFYEFMPRQKTILDKIPKKIRYTIYMFSVKEWNLGKLMNNLYWEPLKSAGNSLEFLTFRRVLIFLFPAYFIFGIGIFYKDKLPSEVTSILPSLMAFIGLTMVLKSFTERKRIRFGWAYIIMGHFWVVLAMNYNEHIEWIENILYLSGVVIAGTIGFGCLQKLKDTEVNINLDRFRGHAYEHPIMAFVFLLCSLGISGFPISPTFIGEDLFFSHIHEEQFVLATLISIGFILNGLSVIRIFAREFLGPHIKTYHELAYRSS
jgi:NADH:ubiquinone oxidoreductase subunit 5 (subunit L)/multisubunit Na+/H+ antiporter MnhA subunit